MATYLLFLLLSSLVTFAFEVKSLTSSELAQERNKFDQIVVMFHAPWCGACQQLKPKFIDVAEQFPQSEPSVGFFFVDATQEQPLALQFDITYFPLVVLIRGNEVFEWKRNLGSLTQFASSEMGEISAGVKWNKYFGPFGFVGMWKHRFGRLVQVTLDFHKEHTKELSQNQSILWMMGAMALLSLGLLGFIFLSVLLCTSPEKDKKE